MPDNHLEQSIKVFQGSIAPQLQGCMDYGRAKGNLEGSLPRGLPVHFYTETQYEVQ